MQNQHENVRKRAQTACSIKISYFYQSYDDMEMDSLSDLIPFNIGLSKVDAFCNKIFDEDQIILQTVLPTAKTDLSKVISYLDSSDFEKRLEISNILHEAKCIFDAKRLSKHLNYLAKQQGFEAVFLFLSYCMGVRCKLLALLVLHSSYKLDFTKVNIYTIYIHMYTTYEL